MTGSPGTNVEDSKRDHWLTALAALTDGVIVTNEALLVEFVNNAAEALTGWTQKESAGQAVGHILRCEAADGEPLSDSFLSSLAAQSPNLPVVDDLVLVSRSGGRIAAALSAAMVRNDAGEVTGQVFLLRDRSVEREALLAMKQSETRFRLLFENLGSISSLYEVVYDEAGQPKDYRYLAVNPAFERLIGMRGSTVLGRTLLDVFPATEKHWLDALAEVAISGIPGRLEQHSQELDSYLELTMFRPQPGQLAMISSDITERMRSERALRDSEAKYRFLTENLRDVIWTVDLETQRFLYVSPAVYALRGFTPEEVMAEPLAAAIAPGAVEWMDQRMATRVPQFLAAEADGRVLEFETEEVQQPCKDGTLVWTEVDTRILRNAVTGRLELYGVARDIRERKRSEEERARLQLQLLQSQKMEAVGQLAGGIAHDFNNLLQVILGQLDFASDGYHHAEPVTEALAEIGKAAERASELTRQLLAFGRRQVMQPVVIDLNDLIHSLLKMLRRVLGEQLELRFDTAANLRMIEADRVQVEQVIMNLCVNARDAMPGGGTLTISTCNVDGPPQGRRTRFEPAAAGYVRVAVADTGIGMDAETRSRIFQPFFTTKPVGQGTGLGLATVYGIVLQHRGAIEVESEPGQGARFNIYFPATAAALSSQSAGKGLGDLRGKETILLAEDEDGVRRVTVQTLERAGYHVLAAPNGQDAVKLFAEHSQGVALALLDVTMPKLGGLAAARQIQAQRPNLPVLFLSGYNDSMAGEEPLPPEIPLLQKPYQPQALLVAIRGLLDQRQ